MKLSGSLSASRLCGGFLDWMPISRCGFSDHLTMKNEISIKNMGDGANSKWEDLAVYENSRLKDIKKGVRSHEKR